MTCKEFNKKYNKDNEFILSEEYVNDCFDMYETEGFAETFQSPYDEYRHHNGKKFKVVERCSENDGFDLESLPIWLIEFEGGKRIHALPEEICLIER